MVDGAGVHDILQGDWLVVMVLNKSDCLLEKGIVKLVHLFGDLNDTPTHRAIDALQKQHNFYKIRTTAAGPIPIGLLLKLLCQFGKEKAHRSLIIV